MIDVIYLTGGKGVRAKLGYPKQYAYVGGKPLLIHGLEILRSIPCIENIIIPADHPERIKEICKSFDIKSNVIVGGETRQESVYKGLYYVNSKEVLIAEAVRPFISRDFIFKIIDKPGNVIPYTTLNSTPFDFISGNILNRNRIAMVQTPQKYNTNELFESHKIAIKQDLKNCTDDLDLMKKVGICGEYTYFQGPIENIKITYPIDLYIAHAILSNIGGPIYE